MTKTVRILNNLVESFVDYPDNESLSICVVMMGCGHNCKGCQNPLFQNPEYLEGTRIVSVDELSEELKNICHRNFTNKIVLSGGDPLFKINLDFTKELLEKMSSEYDFCIYTGYDIDYVKQNNVKGYQFIKCGTFDISKKRDSDKTDNEIIFASPNQILYNGNNEPLSKDGIYKFN